MNDHDLALAADFMIDEKYDLLAPHIRQHIEKCEQCSKNLMDLTDALNGIKFTQTVCGLVDRQLL